jgi:alkylhydroperoxidase family enzyme
VQVPLGAQAPNFEPRIKALMKACDEFHNDRMVSSSTWAELEQHYSTRKMLEVLMLIGHYEMLAGVLNSTGLPLDAKLEKLL